MSSVLSPASLAILSSYQQYKTTQQPTNSSDNQPRILPTSPPITSSVQGAAPALIAAAVKPISISSEQLARTNAIRSSLGLSPLEQTTNVKVAPPTPPESPGGDLSTVPKSPLDDPFSTTRTIINIPGGTNPYVSHASDVGAKAIQIFDESGKVLDTIPIKDAEQVLPLALQNLGASGQKLSIGFTQPSFTGIPGGSGPLIGDKVLGSRASEVYRSPLTEFIKGSNEGINSLINTIKATGAFILSGGKSGLPQDTTPDIISSVIGSPVRTVTSPTGETSTTISGENVKTNIDELLKQIQENPAREIGRTLPTIESFLLPVGEVGAGIKILGGTARDLFSGSTGTVKSLTQSFREGSNVFKVDKTPGSPYYEFTQGTEGRTANLSPKIETSVSVEKQPTIEKIPGFGTAEIPSPYVSSIESKLPGEVKIPQAPGTKPPEIPQAFINPRGSTLIVKNNINEALAPNRILAKGLDPIQAKNLGLNLVPGSKDLFIGNVNRKLLGELETGSNLGRIKPVTDLYEFSSNDLAVNPERYTQLINNPELFNTNLFESFTRPSVIRYYEAQNIGADIAKGSVGGSRVTGQEVGSRGIDQYLRSIGIQTGKAVRSKRAFKPLDLSNIEPGKIGAGASGRAAKLELKTQDVLRNVARGFGKGGFKVSVRSDYLGAVSSPQQKHERLVAGRNVRTELQTIRYPPGTGIKTKNVNLLDQVSNKINTRIAANLGTVTSQRTKLKQVQKTQGVRIRNKPTQTERVKIKSVVVQLPKVRIKQIQPVPTKQRQDTTTKTTTTTKITTDGGPKIPGIPPIGGGFIPGGSGGGKRKRQKVKSSLYIYSVNPNITGAIAQEGLPGKIVGDTTEIFKKFKFKKYV